MLGGAVGRNIAIAGQPCGGGDVDDPCAASMGFQIRQRRLRDVEDSRQINREHVAPHIQRGLFERRTWRLSGIVDEKGDRPECLPRFHQPGGNSFRFRHIEAVEDESVWADSPAKRLQRFAATASQRHTRPGLRQRRGDGSTDAASGAGDERVPSFEGDSV